MFARLFNTDRGSLVKRIGLGAAFVVTLLALSLAVLQPTYGAVAPQGNMPHEDDTPGAPNPMGSGMMSHSMMGSGIMGSSSSISPTMPMATEMHAMLDDMNAMMATMPVSGTLSMDDMGSMMQMMAMMHQHMGAMHMMAGEMMSGGMMGNGMMTDMPCTDGAATSAPPAAAQADEPPADDDPADDVPSEPVEEAERADAVHPPLVANPVRQTAAAGAVTVEVMPLPPSDPLEVAFEVVMDTHSVDLGFDLAQRATLTLGDEAFAATAWEPNAPSGHHISGILRFAIDETTHAAFADAGVVTLELANIDGETLTFVYTVAAE